MQSTVFKPHGPGKLAGSRNLPHECGKCHVVKPSGASAFSVCSGCKIVRYCSREHQVQDWKTHRAFCKRQREYNQTILKNMQENSPLTPSGLSEKEEVIHFLDDFLRLHMHTLRISMQCCIHMAKPWFDVKKKFMLIDLARVKNHGGNPAKAFTIACVQSADVPDGRLPLGGEVLEAWKAFDCAKPMVEAQYGAEKLKPGYLGAILCVFKLEDFPRTTFPIPIYDYDIQSDGPNPEGWYDRMKSVIDNGIVHRFFEDEWKIGVMVKKRANWVWKEKSRVDILRDSGVFVPF